MNKKGIALVIGLIAIIFLTILAAGITARGISEGKLTQRNLERTQAFWLAEAGINKALDNLRIPNTGNIGNTPLGVGGYNVTIGPFDATTGNRTVTSMGFLPFTGTVRAQHTIQAVMHKFPLTPTDFYDNAIYSSGNVNISGNSYSITGNVVYHGTISDTSHILGTATNNAQSPLPLLSFDQLRQISINQGNYHDADHLNGPFPNTFWYDVAGSIPNVVFLEGNLDLKGKTTVGGFFVVGGEVIYDATVNGNVAIKGSVYTRGNFTINGGGNALNVDGGVWASQTTLNGGVDVHYNATYMNAIRNLHIDTSTQIISWQDTENPYRLVP